MQSIKRRLSEIELRQREKSRTPATAELTPLELAISALMRAYGSAPDGELVALRLRIDSDTMTDADCQMLDSLPPCGKSPDDVVRLLVGVLDKF